MTNIDELKKLIPDLMNAVRKDANSKYVFTKTAKRIIREIADFSKQTDLWKSQKSKVENEWGLAKLNANMLYTLLVECVASAPCPCIRKSSVILLAPELDARLSAEESQYDQKRVEDKVYNTSVLSKRKRESESRSCRRDEETSRHVVVENVRLAHNGELHRFYDSEMNACSAIYSNGERVIACERENEKIMVKAWNDFWKELAAEMNDEPVKKSCCDHPSMPNMSIIYLEEEDDDTTLVAVFNDTLISMDEVCDFLDNEYPKKTNPYVVVMTEEQFCNLFAGENLCAFCDEDDFDDDECDLFDDED